jgi:hypothetical protein
MLIFLIADAMKHLLNSCRTTHLTFGHLPLSALGSIPGTNEGISDFFTVPQLGQ